MNFLASPEFNAQQMCGTLCIQHKVNEFLEGYQKGHHGMPEVSGPLPRHVDFI